MARPTPCEITGACLPQGLRRVTFFPLVAAPLRLLPALPHTYPCTPKAGAGAPCPTGILSVWSLMDTQVHEDTQQLLGA